MSYSRRPKVDETMWDKANRSARRVLSSTQGFGTLFFAHLNQRDAYGEYPEMCETKQKTKYLYARTPRRKEREREKERKKETKDIHWSRSLSLILSLSLSHPRSPRECIRSAPRARYADIFFLSSPRWLLLPKSRSTKNSFTSVERKLIITVPHRKKMYRMRA
jgi:hypothetical protein